MYTSITPDAEANGRIFFWIIKRLYGSRVRRRSSEQKRKTEGCNCKQKWFEANK